MERRIALVALLVADYDEAIAYYTGTLGFTLVEDRVIAGQKRWVVVAPGAGTGLLLARAADETQRRAVGAQTGGRVFLFLETDDFAGDYASLRQRGVVFEGPPRSESYGTVAVFTDLYGNRWDLLGPPG